MSSSPTLRIIQLKSDKNVEVDEWSSYMNNNIDCCIESIKQDNFSIESWFKCSIANKDYLFAYIRPKNSLLKNAVNIEKFEVDDVHALFKKACWDSVIDSKLILDINNP